MGQIHHRICGPAGRGAGLSGSPRCIKAKARGKRGKRGKRTASTFLRMVSKVGEGSGLTDGADRIRFAIGEVDGAIAPDCDPPRAERDGAQRGAVNEG